MPNKQEPPPESPSAIAMRTGMDVPGGLNTVTPEGRSPVLPTARDLGLVPGQSGAEGVADLPRARVGDPKGG
ncbi:MAG TPA: hypothetical protein VGK74_24960 [Symbiobacteriaceae bacterium]|jgi:hypothetical protein